MAEKINTDNFPATRDEATELCIHHLRLAALFFEAGDADVKRFFDELDRQEKLTNDTKGYIPPWTSGARHFLSYINERYKEMERYD